MIPFRRELARGYREQYADSTEEGLGIINPPRGSVPFDPNGSIPLPLPIAGDVEIFSFRVPQGYDGIILGQYHGYTKGFEQGSGDLIWRVSADGRWLKDCGNMLVSLGTNRTMSPIHGGLMVRPGNWIRYFVNAGNAGGSVTAGGNIIAGLRGYFWPRV